MDKSWVVRGQHNDAKDEIAKRMRRQMTRAEAMLWRHLRSNQLGGLHFRRQQVIDGYIADFYCHAGALVIEVDGGVHATQTVADAERDRAIGTRGLRVLRVANERVMHDLDAVLAEILVAAGEGSLTPCPPSREEGGTQP